MLRWDNPREIGEWVHRQGGGYSEPGTYTAIGYTRHGELVSGATFSNCNGKHCLVNTATLDRTFSISFFSACLFYVFHQLTLRRVTFIIEQDNLRSQNLVTRMGAKREATLREAGRSGDLFIYSLFPEDCVIWSRLRERFIRPLRAEPGNDYPPARVGESEDVRLPTGADEDKHLRADRDSFVVENSDV